MVKYIVTQNEFKYFFDMDFEIEEGSEDYLFDLEIIHIRNFKDNEGEISIKWHNLETDCVGHMWSIQPNSQFASMIPVWEVYESESELSSDYVLSSSEEDEGIEK